MDKTVENLKSAFAGESQANRKYLAFAKKAEGEGKKGIAKLFRVAAEGETIHALKHLQVLGEVKTTKENLGVAVAGENYEIESMYPSFLVSAKEDGNKGAEMSFDNALQVEKIHAKFFREALEKLEKGEDVADVDYYICPICGFPASVEAPDFCPVCKAPKERFEKI